MLTGVLYMGDDVHGDVAYGAHGGMMQEGVVRGGR